MTQSKMRKPRSRGAKPAAPAKRPVRSSILAQRRRTVLVLSLDKLSKQLQSDVLSDPSISTEFGVEVTNSVTFGSALSFPREALFAAFREAIRRKRKITVKDGQGVRTKAVAVVDDNGVGSVTLGNTRYLVSHAGLLAPDAPSRKAFMARFLQRNSLHADLAAEVVRLTTGPASDQAAFKAMTALAASPEAFLSLFKEKLEKADGQHTILRSDILPDDERYWDNLAPPPQGRTTVAAYVSDVLVPEVRRRLTGNDADPFAMLTPLFISPGSVPHAAFDIVSTNALVAMIEKRLSDEGHFALLGIVEICAGHLADDPRFALLGKRALQRLFSDMAHLERSCALFAPFFVIATAYLAEHEKFQARPVYWRRLAAAAHAELIVRACRIANDEYSGLLRWAIRISGSKYMMSVFADMAEEPRWRPDWIATNFLVADAVGRVRGALAAIVENARPPTWQAIVSLAEAWIDKKHLGPLTMFPCILEGARTPAPGADLAAYRVADELAAFRKDPSLDHLTRQVGFSYIIGFAPDMLGTIAAAMDNVRRDPRTFADSDVQLACSIAAHAAACAQDGVLATLISDIVLEKLRGVTESNVLFEAICILLISAAGHADSEVRRKDIGLRLEYLAFGTPSSPALFEVAAAITALRAVQPTLAASLGRAAAAARLAAP